MENIHLLPTDKPSRLGQSVFDNSFHYNPNFYELEEKRVIPQNIYITSDEEIISLSEINSLPLSDGKDIQTNMSNI